MILVKPRPESWPRLSLAAKSWANSGFDSSRIHRSLNSYLGVHLEFLVDQKHLLLSIISWDSIPVLVTYIVTIDLLPKCKCTPFSWVPQICTASRATWWLSAMFFRVPPGRIPFEFHGKEDPPEILSPAGKSPSENLGFWMALFICWKWGRFSSPARESRRVPLGTDWKISRKTSDLGLQLSRSSSFGIVESSTTAQIPETQWFSSAKLLWELEGRRFQLAEDLSTARNWG